MRLIYHSTKGNNQLIKIPGKCFHSACNFFELDLSFFFKRQELSTPQTVIQMKTTNMIGYMNPISLFTGGKI